MKKLDPTRSRIRIRTYAEGLFSRFAHDLELVCADVAGTADGTAATAEIVIPVARIEVAGVLSGERVDPKGISERDKAECTAKMRHEVFHGEGVIRATASLAGSTRAALQLVFPNGRALEREIDVEVEPGAELRARGKTAISLAAIGSLAVKGPMNAFRVKDGVDVLFDVVFV